MTDMDDLIAKARFYESAGHVAAYSESALELLNLLADALEAATEKLDRARNLIELREFEIDNLDELITELRAERDAALAAIERVRAVHRKFTYYELEDSCPDTSEEHREERHHESDEIGEFYCEDMPTGDVVCDLCRDADGERMDWPCPTVAALDGAPEAEWEYGVEVEGEVAVRPKAIAERASDSADYATLVRRRKAGPWLPVEGENK